VREFDIREYGAREDGSAVSTTAIQHAVDLAAINHGTVVIPRGRFVSGTIYLRSEITISFSAGAFLIASSRPNDFAEYEVLATPSHADDETSYFAHSLFYGVDVANVAIIGPGVIDGNGVARGGPKPMAFKRSRQVSIHGITIVNSPNYCLSLLGCTDVRIESVTIRDSFVDGITADCCRYVSIKNCYVQSANDAICLKASLALGYRHATENVLIANCVLSTSRSAFKIGSESSGNFKNIAVTDCEMILSLQGVLGGAAEAGIMLQAIDGGSVENIFVSQIRMTHVRIPIFLRLGNRGRGQDHPCPGKLRNIVLRRVYASGAETAAVISGIPGADIQNVRIERLEVSLAGGVSADAAARDVPEKEAGYPRPSIFGTLPAHGLFCRHVDRLSIQRVCFRLENFDGRPAVFVHNVRRTTVLDFDTVDSTGLQTTVYFPATGSTLENEVQRIDRQTEVTVGHESPGSPASDLLEDPKETRQ
jgi:polygalacturonase